MTTSPRPGLTGPLPLPWEPGSLLLPGPQVGEFHIIHILFNSSSWPPETRLEHYSYLQSPLWVWPLDPSRGGPPFFLS